ncbi:helix-turn-helix transcriptional regulator [Margalitia sp. FSL K6-0131]|uniref:helix-turn-helix domain-containing protein n=1 Tax=Margalitia sp. FSL K6-0131 TaxID=2954604 RepID=UPI0030FB9778
MKEQIERRHAPYSKFKAFLVENNINQQEVADLLGKSKSALNQNLNGTGGDFSLKELRIICKKFNISADDYFLYPNVSKMKPEIINQMEEMGMCNNFKSQ